MRTCNLFIKRFMDIVCSGLGLVVLSPMFLLVSLMIKITMPGPVFFMQQRVGKGGVLFNIIKFRSMKVDTQAESVHDTSKDEQRLTLFGRLIRRLKIDELPQLLNVFKGDMSLIGPRPTFKEQVENYTNIQRHRLDMRPGMTGLAQVNGNGTLSWNRRIEYDLVYINHFSILLDIRIMIKTVLVIIFGEGKFRNKCGV